MAYVMTKQGNLDNCVTYEFMCDTVQDMNDIENRYRTIGSIAIVLEGYSGMEVYIAGSDKQWRALSAIGGGSGSEGTESNLPIYTKTIEGATIEIENVNMASNAQEIDINTALLREGPAIVEIGNYSYEVDFLHDVYDGAEWFENTNDSLVITFCTTDSSLQIYDREHTFTELQTVRIIYPTVTKLYSTQDSLYLGTDANGNNGTKVITINNNSIAVGGDVTASGFNSQAFGYCTIASEYTSHAEGCNTVASGESSHAEGENTEASGYDSHAEGYGSVASEDFSHAEGYNTEASGGYSHAEGYETTASGTRSHAEGWSTEASGSCSHTEGIGTISSGEASHVAGKYNVEDIWNSWPEWQPSTSYQVGDKVRKVVAIAIGTYAYKGFICTTANSSSNFDASQWKSSEERTYAEIIGNGTADISRSNARALDWSGNEYLKGDLYVGCNADSTGGTKVTPLPALPVSDGTYTLQCTVSSGVATYSWVSTT